MPPRHATPSPVKVGESTNAPTTRLLIWSRLSRREERASRRLYAGGGSCSRDICGTHGGYETAEVRDVRKIGGGGGCMGGPGKLLDGVFPV